MTKDEKDFYARRDAWFDWHQANPRVWSYFNRFATEAASRGKHVGHWLLVNRIRWEIVVETTGPDFKISNNFIAFYARWWIEQNPGHRAIFTIKPMKGEPWPFVSLFSDLV